MEVCSSIDCDKTANFTCPTCTKLGVTSGLHFCSKDCFQKSWNSHKASHKQARSIEKLKDEINSGYKFTGSLKPFPLTAKRDVPDFIIKPDYADHPRGYSESEKISKNQGYIQVLNKEEQEGLRKACQLGREVMDIAAKSIKVGITTDEIDRIVHEACIERNCYPSPLNYFQFPKSVCTSVNEVICHGIPDTRPLEDGDLVNVDITVYHGGYHGDLNETFFVGNVDADSKKLVSITHECLMKAIDLVKPGVKYRDIGNVIQKHAQAHGFSVVRSFCGHGIHKVFHTLPNVPHYAIESLELPKKISRPAMNFESPKRVNYSMDNKTMGVMQAGHAFTIEPMINQGTWKDVIWPDEWTAATMDGKRSAQFEHTLLVTENGCEVLTARNDPVHKSQPHFMDKYNS